MLGQGKGIYWARVVNRQLAAHKWEPCVVCDTRLARISICMHFCHASLVLSLPLRSDLFLSDIKELFSEEAGA